MENFVKAEKNFYNFFRDEIDYIYDRQTDISKSNLSLDMSKLKDPRFEKLFFYCDPKNFIDKYDEEAFEKEKDNRIDPDEDTLVERPNYIDKIAEYCDEKIFSCPKCKTGDLNFIEMRQHIYNCPHNYIRNYFYPEITFEPGTNGELTNYSHQYVKIMRVQLYILHR